MTYGVRPWDIELLTRREWQAICDDWNRRQREVSDG